MEWQPVHSPTPPEWNAVAGMAKAAANSSNSMAKRAKERLLRGDGRGQENDRKNGGKL
jgi:hypothetical protein